MRTPRKDWTLLVGADLTEPTRNAIHHVNAVFEGCPADERPRVVLFTVVEQAIAPGAEFGEPSFAWDAGGVSGMTPPVDDAEMERIEQSALAKLDPLERMLTEAGWSAERIERRAAPGGFSKALIADVIAYHARENDARIVVVGRTRHGRLHEALLKSIGERLTHYLPGITVWVVGTPEHENESESESEQENNAEAERADASGN